MPVVVGVAVGVAVAVVVLDTRGRVAWRTGGTVPNTSTGARRARVWVVHVRGDHGGAGAGARARVHVGGEARGVRVVSLRARTRTLATRHLPPVNT